MKLVKQILIVASLLAFAGAAYAQTLTVSGVAFNPASGVDSPYQWNATPDASIPQINVNLPFFSTQFFSYGDFSYDNTKDKGSDATFTASFVVTPPGTTVSDTADIIINGHTQHNSDGTLSLNFNNTPIDVYFGTGGEYSVTFLDLDGISENQWSDSDLWAQITLISDSDPCGTNPNPVPEPGTLFLLGAGIAGMVYLKRRNKA